MFNKNFFFRKKFLLFNLFFGIYIFTNLVGGERGIISYFEKKQITMALEKKEIQLINEINKLEKKNELLSEKMNLDYLDTLYREKLNYGLKDEKIIKLK
tara:strand:+ start:43 stop:339 length:297 start_codon:yes stop_codon:yes gene_type:complete